VGGHGGLARGIVMDMDRGVVWDLWGTGPQDKRGVYG
jgi:hypothetical protein